MLHNAGGWGEVGWIWRGRSPQEDGWLSCDMKPSNKHFKALCIVVPLHTPLACSWPLPTQGLSLSKCAGRRVVRHAVLPRGATVAAPFRPPAVGCARLRQNNPSNLEKKRYLAYQVAGRGTRSHLFLLYDILGKDTHWTFSSGGGSRGPDTSTKVHWCAWAAMLSSSNIC